MAEQVEISNVGNDGVASEATLLNLLAAMEALGGDKGKSAAAKAQRLYNKAQKDGIKIIDTERDKRKDNSKETGENTKKLKRFGDALADATVSGIFAVGASLKNFAAEVLMGGNQMGDFVQHLPLVGDYLGLLTGYFQNSVDTFRQLSDVGAGFGGDLFAMRQASADASLSLEQFASMVGNNSTTLTMLGSTVTQGAQRLGSMTKELRSSERGLMQLGFTQESLNEGMVDYLENQALAGQLRGRSDRSLIEGAQNYLTELDKLSKITGKNRKELQEQMNQNAQAANINVLRARLSGEALQNFDNNLAHLTTMVPGLGDAFKDLSDGIPQTEVGQVLTSLVPGFKELAEANATGRISQEEFQRRLAQLTPQITRAFDSMDPAQVQALMGKEGFDGLLGSLAEVRTYTQRQTKAAAAAAEQADADAKRQPLTAFLTNFEQTVQDVRSKFESAFIDSKVLDFIGTELAAGTGTLLDQINGLADSLQEYLSGDDFKKDFQTFKDAINDTKEAISNFMDNFRKFDLKTALFGAKAGDEVNGETLEEDVQGLFGGGEGGGLMSWVMDGIKSSISGLLNFDITWDDIIVGGIVGLGALIAAPVIGLPGLITAAIIGVVGKDKLIELFKGTWETITGFFSFGTGEDAASYSIGNLASGAWETVKGWWTWTGDALTYSISNLATNAWNTVTGWFGLDGTTYSVSDLAADAWNTVTGWFGLDGTTYSVSDLAADAWNTVTGWFGLDGTTYSISQLATDAWNTVKGYFTFGEDAPAFSIQNLAQTAWDTVTGFFSLENFELPSIKDMFQGIIDKVKGFFDFDFEMPNFKAYLPTWLGGEGKSLFGDDNTVSAQASIDATPAVEGAESLMDTQSAIATFANIENLQDNLDIIKNGLDTDGVRSYTEAMLELVDALEKLNEELSGSQNSRGRGRSTQNAASVLTQISPTSGGGSATDEVNSTLRLVLDELKLHTAKQGLIEVNTRSRGNDIARSVS